VVTVTARGGEVDIGPRADGDVRGHGFGIDHVDRVDRDVLIEGGVGGGLVEVREAAENLQGVGSCLLARAG
jgi:hypothetical protein